MATKKEKFDGRSRPSNDLYRENFNKLQQEQRDLEESYQQSKLNKKERTLNEELMEGFKKEQEDLKDEEEQ